MQQKITKQIPITHPLLGANYAYGVIDKKTILKKNITPEQIKQVETAIDILRLYTERVYVEFVDPNPILNHRYTNMFIGIQYNITRFSNTILQTLISFMVGESRKPSMGTMVNLTTRFKGKVKEIKNKVVFEKCDFGKADIGKYSDIIIPEDTDKIENLQNKKGYEPFECKMTVGISEHIQEEINKILVLKPYITEEKIENKKLKSKDLLE